MKILITGTTGRLGGQLARHFRGRHELICPGRSQLDLAKPDTLPAGLRGINFDLLINCAGITSPDTCAREPELAARVNTEAPTVFATECQRRKARMIQVSTDYVFAGEVNEPLSEEHPAEPVNHYGATKLRAEQAVLANCPEGALVTRVSWLFGAGNSFPDQVLRTAVDGQQVEAIADKWSAPTSVHDISKWLETLCIRAPMPTGVLHVCNSGTASWQTYAQAILDIANELGILKEPLVAKGNNLDEFRNFIAKRPRHTLMSNQRLAGLLGHPVRTWQEALREWMTSRAS